MSISEREAVDMKVVKLSTIPNCDLCEHFEGRDFPAQFDSPISGIGGSWGYLCLPHMLTDGSVIGSRIEQA